MDWFISLTNKGIKELNLLEAIQSSKINKSNGNVNEDKLNDIMKYVNIIYD